MDNDLPSPHRMPPAIATETADDDIVATRRRTIDGAWHCAEILLGQIARDHERCGKAACARSRRCRGFACVPGGQDGETEGAAVGYGAAEQTGR